jgi:hypothetical protein
VKPDAGLVDVMLLVDKSIIGAFEVVTLEFAADETLVASDPGAVVDVGDGELDDAL